MNLDDQETAVADFMEMLIHHRKNCEKQGRYAEAEVARKRLEELQRHDSERKAEVLRSRQLAEILAIEEAHMQEFQQFNLMQDEKMMLFEREAQNSMDALVEKHGNELRDYQRSLLSKTKGARFSRQYHDLRHLEQKYAAMKNYEAASDAKEKADTLMVIEEEKWAREHQADMAIKERLFQQRMRVEAEALKKRIALSRADLNRQRQQALEKVLLRYNNVKADAVLRHKLEKQRFEKEIAKEKSMDAVRKPPRTLPPVIQEFNQKFDTSQGLTNTRLNNSGNLQLTNNTSGRVKLPPLQGTSNVSPYNSVMVVKKAPIDDLYYQKNKGGKNPYTSIAAASLFGKTTSN